MKERGFRFTQSKYSVRRWHKLFAEAGDVFPNPHPRAAAGQKQLPLFFEQNPKAKAMFTEYADSNLNTLGSLIMTEFVNDTLIPGLLADYNSDKEEGVKLDKEQFMKLNGFLRSSKHARQEVAQRTVLNWMNHLGYKYCKQTKHYFNDKHEDETNVLYRNDFTRRYFGYEKRAHRWIQVTKEEAEKLVRDGKVHHRLGCHYKDSDGNEMVEYHVDDSDCLFKMGSSLKYGGNLSHKMKADEKPLVMFGQDEAIFKQYLLSPRAWCGRNGERPLLPKDEGQGVMLSVFQSREFGFGFDNLSEEELQRINAYRANTEYADQEAAVAVKGEGGAKKKDLKAEPFNCEFEYGANKEGYWTYDHMYVQFEDCLDVLTVLHPEFDYVFLFDHSCGHDRQRRNGLNVYGNNKEYGGSVVMRQSKITQEKGFIGPHKHEHVLKPGETQYMVFEKDQQNLPREQGPFYIADERERIRLKDDKNRASENRLVEKSKTELLDELAMKDVLPANPTKTKKDEIKRMAGMHDIAPFKCPGHQLKRVQQLKSELADKPGIDKCRLKRDFQKLAHKNHISLYNKEDDIEKGWIGQPKGMLQLLWERGFIDPSVEDPKRYYSKEGKTATGVIDPTRSLNLLMKQLYDFVHELTLLQFKGSEIGKERGIEIIVDRTPKCHCEMAGEGIEYSWGFAKNSYRRYAMEEKKSKEKFRASVKKCLNRDHVTTELVQKFSRRARRYMIAYQLLEVHGDKVFANEEEIACVNNQYGDCQDKATPIKIEKLTKMVKCHPSAGDFDKGFINRMFNEIYSREKK
jgi:hypothetical protein